MKSFAFILAFVFTMIVAAQTAYASGGLPIRNAYSSTNVTTTSYVELVASTVKGIKGVSVANSGSAPVKIAFGASGSEVDQIVVPQTSAITPVVYPISGGYGTRISVISLVQTNSTGELDVNLLYN